MRILDFGKNKGKILADCEESYLKWLASHEKVVAKRNQWACRDARFILERMAKEAAAQAVAASKLERLEELANAGDFLAAMDLRMTKFLVSNKVESKTDLSTKGNLYKPFALMR
jgi:hypothetical protein